MATLQPKRPTRADLARQVMELKAQLAYNYHYADAKVGKASTEHMLGGAVIVQLFGLGGREIIDPVAIRDGLSDETIAALRKDIKRSYDLAVQFKPKER